MEREGGRDMEREGGREMERGREKWRERDYHTHINGCHFCMHASAIRNQKKEASIDANTAAMHAPMHRLSQSAPKVGTP